MSRKLIAAAALTLTAVALAGLAHAGRVAAHQQIAMSYANGNASKVTLTPITPGSIAADTGSTTWCCFTEKTIRQDGQLLDVDNPLATFVGKNGTLVWRERITWVDLANGYSIATGTWRIVRGTGAYEHATGQGHLAFVSTAGTRILSYRAVGLVAAG
jgi:hypothetical protein